MVDTTMGEWVWIQPAGVLVYPLLPNIHSDAPTNKVVEFSTIIAYGGFTDLPG